MNSPPVNHRKGSSNSVACANVISRPTPWAPPLSSSARSGCANIHRTAIVMGWTVQLGASAIKDFTFLAAAFTCDASSVLITSAGTRSTSRGTGTDAAFFNGGQDCTAATRVIVHESIHDQLVEALVRNAEKLRPGAPSDPDAFYGPLNNINHFNAVSDKIANLPASAKIVTGGKRSGETGFFFEPTVITGVAQSDDIVQEETFGPILTVQSFSDEKEAITLANDVRFGLASSIWTKDHGVTQRVSAALDFGAVWINCHIPLVAEMPHGGFKYSGYGKDLSAYGVEDYTRLKHVMSSHD
eukprot:gene24668-29586_t